MCLFINMISSTKLLLLIMLAVSDAVSKPASASSALSQFRPTSNSSDFFSGTNTGDATWYATGLVACGQTYKDTDYIAAISYRAFEAYWGASVDPTKSQSSRLSGDTH
jgi:hypothetical protein